MNTSELHIDDLPIEILKKNPFGNSEENEKSPSAEKVHGLQIITQDTKLAELVLNQLSLVNCQFANVYIKCIGSLKESDPNFLIPIIVNALYDNTLSIFIGFDKRILKSVFDGLQFSEKFFNIVHLQDSVGLNKEIDTLIMPLRDPWLFRLHLLATQAILTESSFTERNHARGLEVHRLGNIRGNLASVEPEIRSAEVFSINLNALKNSDASCQSRKSPIGLTAEEACQLVHYAGRAEKNRFYCISEIDVESVAEPSNAHLITNLLWYYIQGVDLRSAVYPPLVDDMQAYVVEGLVENLSLLFFKDEKQQKWWLKFPLKDGKYKGAMPFIACDYEDYSLAVADGVLSERLRNSIVVL